MNWKEKEDFHYTYSANQQEEIKNIRKKYVAPEEDKMTLLRRMDKDVTKKASTVALTVGTIGILILGFGMSLIMSDFNKILGSYQDMGMFLGIISGMAGIVIICCAYPLYNRIIRKEREKIAPEILRLTDELMK